MGTFVVPTYSGHLHEAVSLISQIRQKELIANEIILVLSKDDEYLFRDVSVKHSCKIVFIEDALRKYIGRYTDAADVINTIGKFRFQALKKLFGVSEAQTDDVFVLDSECNICNDPCKLFFPSYEQSYVLYSERIWDRQSDSLSNAVRRECNYLLGSLNTKWFFESYNWLYSKHIVCDLLDALSIKHGPEWVLRPEPLFECQLYYQFCFEGKLGYCFESVSNVLLNVLSDAEVRGLLSRFDASMYRAAGVFEYLGSFLEKEKYIEVVTNPDVVKYLKMLRHEPSIIYDVVDSVREKSMNDYFIGEASMHRGQFLRGKIAVIVSGRFNSERDVDNLYSLLCRLDADVYVSTDTLNPYISRVNDIIKPIKVVTVDDESLIGKFSSLLLVNENVEKNTKQGRDIGVASMFEQISVAFDAIEAHEIENGFKYNIVVRIRPDIFSVNTISDVFMQVAERYGSFDGAIFFPNRFWSQGVNDQFFFGKRDDMAHLLKNFSGLGYLSSDYLNPEWYLSQLCLKQSLSVIPFEFQYLLTRGNYPDVDGVTHAFSMQERLFWSRTSPVPAMKDATAYVNYATQNIKFKNDFDFMRLTGFDGVDYEAFFVRLDSGGSSDSGDLVLCVSEYKCGHVFLLSVKCCLMGLVYKFDHFGAGSYSDMVRLECIGEVGNEVNVRFVDDKYSFVGDALKGRLLSACGSRLTSSVLSFLNEPGGLNVNIKMLPYIPYMRRVNNTIKKML